MLFFLFYCCSLKFCVVACRSWMWMGVGVSGWRSWSRRNRVPDLRQRWAWCAQWVQHCQDQCGPSRVSCSAKWCGVVGLLLSSQRHRALHTKHPSSCKSTRGPLVVELSLTVTWCHLFFVTTVTFMLKVSHCCWSRHAEIGLLRVKRSRVALYRRPWEAGAVRTQKTVTTTRTKRNTSAWKNYSFILKIRQQSLVTCCLYWNENNVIKAAGCRDGHAAQILLAESTVSTRSRLRVNRSPTQTNSFKQGTIWILVSPT